MKFPWLHHPDKGPDVMTTLLAIVTIASAVKFLLDGVSLVINGHTVTFGHSDSMSYASILGPVFGGHAYMSGSGNTPETPDSSEIPDNVDEEG
jgi:hypothetical protein